MLLFLPTPAPDEFEDPPAKKPRGPTETPPDASTLGVKIFLASLLMLFGATLIGYVITRVSVRSWEGYKVPGLNAGLALSTAFIVGVSVALHFGLRAIQRGGYSALKRWMVLACFCALAFLVNQVLNWTDLIRWRGLNNPDLSLFLFYLMTVLHALHVIGGYVPLSAATWRAWHEHYAPARYRGLYNCALYWHFIDGVWVLMALAFLIG